MFASWCRKTMDIRHKRASLVVNGWMRGCLMMSMTTTAAAPSFLESVRALSLLSTLLAVFLVMRVMGFVSFLMFVSLVVLIVVSLFRAAWIIEQNVVNWAIWNDRWQNSPFFLCPLSLCPASWWDPFLCLPSSSWWWEWWSPYFLCFPSSCLSS